MPKDYDNYKDKSIISPWTRYFKGKGDKKHEVLCMLELVNNI